MTDFESVIPRKSDLGLRFMPLFQQAANQRLGRLGMIRHAGAVPGVATSMPYEAPSLLAFAPM